MGDTTFSFGASEQRLHALLPLSLFVVCFCFWMHRRFVLA